LESNFCQAGIVCASAIVSSAPRRSDDPDISDAEAVANKIITVTRSALKIGEASCDLAQLTFGPFCAHHFALHFPEQQKHSIDDASAMTWTSLAVIARSRSAGSIEGSGYLSSSHSIRYVDSNTGSPSSGIRYGQLLKRIVARCD